MGNPITQSDHYEVATTGVLRTLATIAFLLIILASAAYLRLVGLDWDEGQHLHPDERFMTMVGNSMHPVSSLAEYFDTLNSTLNPNNVGYGFYVYGNFPVILVRYVGEAVKMTGYSDLHLVGRVISAMADLLSLVLLFFAGKKLFDWRVSLLSAGLYGAAALPIQLSHYYTVDILANLFAVAGFLMIVRVFSEHHWADYPIFGITLGLAMASKVSTAPIAAILILALALRVMREHHLENQIDVDQELPVALSNALIKRAAIGLVIAGLVTVIVFRIAQPYAFLPPNSGVPIDTENVGSAMSIISWLSDPIGLRLNPEWLRQMSEVRAQVAGDWDAPPNHQWAHRLPLIFPWINMVRVGLGWPLGIWCWLAFAWAIWEIVRRHQGSGQLVLPVVWVVLFFTWQGVSWVKTMRYFISVYPVLILLGAWAIITLWDRIRKLLASRNMPRWHWPSLASLGIAAVVVISAYAWGFAVSRIFTRPVTRVEASRWLLENIPSDITFLLETSDGPRQFQLGLVNNWSNPDESSDDPIHPGAAHTSLTAGLVQSVTVQFPFDGTLTGIRFNHIVDPGSTGADRTLQVTLSSSSTALDAPLVAEQITSDFGAGDDPRGTSYLIEPNPVALTANQSYTLTLKPDESGPLHLFGANLATEGAWDDSLPLSLAPYNVWGAQIQEYPLEIVWEDAPEKRERFQHVLDRVDYIVISSNRFYASLPRNPQRFPMVIAYYRALFSGDLGFDLVGDFTSRPNIGPIRFHDDNAEEAWTVYDHPRVLVFRKSDRYSSQNTAAILGSVNLSKVVKNAADRAAGPPVTIPMPKMVKAAPAGARQIGFAGNSISDTIVQTGETRFFARFQPITVILWWLLILMIGWLSFPILYVLFPGLPDRGYPLCRMFSLLVAAWVGWILASSKIVPWSGWSVVLGLGALAALSTALIFPGRCEFIAWLKGHRRHLIVIEVIFAVLFIGFVLIRLGNPDLWHPSFGGEKPMNLAYFNAVLRSTTFPPYDPWFSGASLDYYYLGYVVVGLPLKIFPIPLTVAYNLILPTLFALTGIGAFSVAYNLIASRQDEPAQTTDEDVPNALSSSLWKTLRAWPRISWEDVMVALRGSVKKNSRPANLYPYIAGIAALLLTVILGNLDEIRTLMWGLAKLGASGPQWAIDALPNLGDFTEGVKLVLGQDRLIPVGLGEWYWNATRVIPVPINEAGIPTEVGPITEFPLFTFLYADLHAHMIAMPITLLALAWCIAQVRGAGLSPQDRGGFGLSLLSLLFGSLVIGSLRPTNTWDWPTYLVLGMGTVLLAHFTRRKAEHLVPALGVGLVFAALTGGAVYLFITSSNPALNLLADRVAVLSVLGGALVGLAVGFGLGQSLSLTRHSSSADAVRGLSHWVTLLGAIVLAGGLAVLSVLLYPPYVLTYRSGYSSFIPWTGSRTPLWAYFDILGLFLFLIISWMVWESWKWREDVRRSMPDQARVLPLLIAGTTCLAMTVLGIVVVSVLQNCPVAVLALPLMIWAIILFLRPGQPIEKRAILAIVSLALALTVMVELMVLQGDIGRMNTVFKFYVQVWILMAAAAGTALGWLWPVIGRAKGSIRTPWVAALVFLVFLAVLYPLLATRAKIADRWSSDAPNTLDGMAYMPYVERHENGVGFNLGPDYHALRWLQDNVQGTPTVLEAHAVEYNWGNRVAVYTGLPAIIGWNWHQRQQHTDQSEEIWRRVTDVAVIYNTMDVERALSLLHHYDVSLIIVGDLERAYYEQAGLDKFKTMVEQGYLKVVYERDQTTIYQMSDE
ncbi:MAG: glycosyltransferase family 39 protein [Anaerolineae bacterium]|nr:glycosyltransferase family 39 protein [Anaerolineae bacterium]